MLLPGDSQAQGLQRCGVLEENNWTCAGHSLAKVTLKSGWAQPKNRCTWIRASDGIRGHKNTTPISHGLLVGLGQPVPLVWGNTKMAEAYLFTCCSKALRDRVGVEIRPLHLTEGTLPSHTTATGVEKPTLGYSQQSLNDTRERYQAGSHSCQHGHPGPVLEWTHYEGFLFFKHSVLHLENVQKKEKQIAA